MGPAALAPIALVVALVMTNGGRAEVGSPGDPHGVGADAGSQPRSGRDQSRPGGDTGRRGDAAPRLPPGGAREQTIGEPVAVGELVVTVVDAALGEDSRGRSQVVVTVTLANESEEAQPYAVAAFSLLTDIGSVLAPSSSARGDALGFGMLEPDDEVTGTLTFDARSGAHILLLDPPTPDGQRLSWAIDV